MAVTIDQRRINRDIQREIKRLETVVGKFSRKEKRKITRKAAQPVARTARTKNFAFPDSKRPHYRYTTDGTKYTYNPGNLRRSIKVLDLRKTSDAYVGPKMSKGTTREFGGQGQPVDGYYAAMLFGSQAAFRRKVMEKALRATAPKVLRVLRKKTIKAMVEIGLNAGFLPG